TLFADLAAIVDCGGRFGGSESELRAKRWLIERMRKIPSVVIREHIFQFEGWRRHNAKLRILSTPQQQQLACHSLVYSPDTPDQGIEAEVIDVGRGTPADFDRV